MESWKLVSGIGFDVDLIFVHIFCLTVAFQATEHHYLLRIALLGKAEVLRPAISPSSLWQCIP